MDSVFYIAGICCDSKTGDILTTYSGIIFIILNNRKPATRCKFCLIVNIYTIGWTIIGTDSFTSIVIIFYRIIWVIYIAVIFFIFNFYCTKLPHGTVKAWRINSPVCKPDIHLWDWFQSVKVKHICKIVVIGIDTGFISTDTHSINKHFAEIRQ